jgi:hypothetical protein
MTKNQALRLALEALENWLEFDPENFGEVDKKAITAIKAALLSRSDGEAKGKPVGTAGELFSNTALERLDLRPSTGIYITPPQRKPLTDEEVIDIGTQFQWYDGDCERFDSIGFARAIEAAHGIKGEA